MPQQLKQQCLFQCHLSWQAGLADIFLIRFLQHSLSSVFSSDSSSVSMSSLVQFVDFYLGLHFGLFPDTLNCNTSQFWLLIP